MDKMREEFEKHLTERLGESFERFTNRAALDSFWLIWQEAWQASRQALVVELPYTVCRTHVFEIPWTNETGMEHDEYFEVEDIHKCINAAGIKYK